MDGTEKHLNHAHWSSTKCYCHWQSTRRHALDMIMQLETDFLMDILHMGVDAHLPFRRAVEFKRKTRPGVSVCASKPEASRKDTMSFTAVLDPAEAGNKGQTMSHANPHERSLGPSQKRSDRRVFQKPCGRTAWCAPLSRSEEGTLEQLSCLERWKKQTHSC